MKLLLVLLLVVGAGGAKAQPFLLEGEGLRPVTQEELQKEPPVFPFAVGEELRYDVHYLGVAVGQAVFRVERFVADGSRRMAHLVLKVRANEFFMNVYRVDDRLEAFVDLDSMRTLETRTLLHHGERIIYEDLSVDWEAHWLELFREERHKGKIREVAFDAGPSVQDILPAFYYMRALPLETRKDVAFGIYASKKIYGFRLPLDRSEDGVDVLTPYTTLDGKRLPNGAGRLWLRGDVPFRLQGWVRTKQGFLIGRVALDLVTHSAPERGYAVHPVESPPVFETVDGRPVWDAPKAVLEERERRGLEPRNIKRYVAR